MTDNRLRRRLPSENPCAGVGSGRRQVRRWSSPDGSSGCEAGHGGLEPVPGPRSPTHRRPDCIGRTGKAVSSWGLTSAPGSERRSWAGCREAVRRRISFLGPARYAPAGTGPPASRPEKAESGEIRRRRYHPPGSRGGRGTPRHLRDVGRDVRGVANCSPMLSEWASLLLRVADFLRNKEDPGHPGHRFGGGIKKWHRRLPVATARRAAVGRGRPASAPYRRACKDELGRWLQQATRA